MDRLYRRRSCRGITLLELVLASVFVAMLSVVMFLSTRSSMDSQRKAWLIQDSQEAVHLATIRLKDELRGARVSSPDVGATAAALEYQKAQMIDQQVVLDGSGNPVWEGPFQVILDLEGRVVSTRENRLISRLGEDSSLEFVRPEQQRLQISVTSRRGSTETGRHSASSQVTIEIVLANN